MKNRGLERIISTAGKNLLGGFLFFSLFLFFFPTCLLAAPPQVVCVPQVPSDLLVPHDTWSGESAILKGIAKDDDGDLSGGSFYWDFGDGEKSTPQSITNPDNLSITHTYDADPGTLYIARLYVTDAAGETSSDDYRILVKEKTLDVEVNKAIDDGLWWLHTHKQSTGPSYCQARPWCLPVRGNPDTQKSPQCHLSCPGEYGQRAPGVSFGAWRQDARKPLAD